MDVEDLIKVVVDDTDSLSKNGAVYIDSSLIVDICQSTLLIHKGLIDQGEIDKDDPRIIAQEAILEMLFMIYSAFITKHADSLAQDALSKVDFDDIIKQAEKYTNGDGNND